MNRAQLAHAVWTVVRRGWHCAEVSSSAVGHTSSLRASGADLLARYQAESERIPSLEPLVAILQSVVDNSMDDRLAVTTSMRDLVITAAPPSKPPVYVIVVRSAPSRTRPALGNVVIEHRATSGLNDSIARPSADVLPLFWRFVHEKYGLVTS